MDCFDRNGKIARWLLYLLFLGFLSVNIFEGTALNVWSKPDGQQKGFNTAEYTEFNQATFYMFDALLRAMVFSVWLLVKKGSNQSIFSDFSRLSACQYVKVFATRFAIQSSEQLATIGKSYLTSATAEVINQLRIPLVGFLGYILFRIKLSRNQILFAMSIIPLAVQFNVRDLEDVDKQVDQYLGYVVMGISVLLLSISNVLVENILKNDFNSFDIMSKQFIMAMIDIPIMLALWPLSTAFEKYGAGIAIRSWNPFDLYFAQTWYMTVSLAINAALWGIFRLCILNWGDALWLNLTCVFVMGILWLIECFILTDSAGESVSKFWVTKLLGLFTFAIILIGYELASWDEEEKTKRTLSKSIGDFLGGSQEIAVSTEYTTTDGEEKNELKEEEDGKPPLYPL